MQEETTANFSDLTSNVVIKQSEPPRVRQPTRVHKKGAEPLVFFLLEYSIIGVKPHCPVKPRVFFVHDVAAEALVPQDSSCFGKYRIALLRHGRFSADIVLGHNGVVGVSAG
jgi:hypothetical protein